jgi:RHH-type rel operon transcriptional repressor/antitoxin RelB
MRTQTVRLSDELSSKLDKAVTQTRRSRSSLLREALERYLEDTEDLEIALSRLRDPGAEWVSHAQVVRELDLD